MSQNFGARICGRPTRLDLRFSVSHNFGTRNLSLVQTTETRMSVSIWQPLWQFHLNVPSGNYSQTKKIPHRAAQVITLSHACSVTRPVGPKGRKESGEDQFNMSSVPLRVTVTWKGEPSSVERSLCGWCCPGRGSLPAP